MAVDPEAKRRWREHRIGDVPLRSVRGVFAVLLIGGPLAFLMLNTLAGIALALAGQSIDSTITRELLLLGFVFNVFLLVILPVLGLVISRPRPLPPPPSPPRIGEPHQATGHPSWQSGWTRMPDQETPPRLLKATVALRSDIRGAAAPRKKPAPKRAAAPRPRRVPAKKPPTPRRRPPRSTARTPQPTKPISPTPQPRPPESAPTPPTPPPAAAPAEPPMFRPLPSSPPEPLPSPVPPSPAPNEDPEPSTAKAVIARLGLQVNRRTPLWLLLGVGVAIASLMTLGLVLTGLVELGIMEEPEESPLIGEIEALLDWPLVILISLVAAFTEEIFFRGVLQPRFGIIASSILFAAVHIGYDTVLQIVAPFFLGLVFGILFQKTRSLWAPIAAHFMFDFIQLSLLLLSR